MAVIKCKSCGNEVTLPENVVQGYCTYCSGQVTCETPAAKPEDKVEVNTQLRCHHIFAHPAADHAIIRRGRKKTTIMLSIIAAVFTVIIFIVADVVVENRNLASGDVCKIKGGVVVDVRYDKEKITKVVIPDGVTEIGDAAFWGCRSLTSVTIGSSVKTIGEYAFKVCSSLKGVIVPEKCKIADNAFPKECLVIKLPAELITKIRQGDAPAILDEWRLALQQGLIFSDGCKTVTGVKNKNITKVTIPYGVTEIGSRAFEGCDSLTSVTIPNSVTKIGYNAFRYCSSLTSVTIGNSVTEIGAGAFEGCYSLTSVTIPDSVTEIGYDAFRYCRSLTSVTIPNSVTEIGWSAFFGCRSLKEVRVPDGCRVGKNAFPDGCRVIRY